MSADFWSGYVSGAAGILIGNPLDLIKTRIQAGNASSPSPSPSDLPGGGQQPLQTQQQQRPSIRGHFDRAGTLVRGTTAPILGYGALNAILFVTYNRTLSLLHTSPPPSSSGTPYSPSDLFKVWCAGAAGGLATFVVSAPTELVKCRAQVSRGPTTSSWAIAREAWRAEGVRGLYYGGGITSVRDAVGYGFYFLSYEWSKQALSSPEDTDREATLKVLLCGGLAGVITWASVFPLDVVKTRVQTQLLNTSEQQRPLLRPQTGSLPPDSTRRLSTMEIARQAYQKEGAGVFFRGLGICSVRAFVVNAVQWAVYEWMMQLLQPT
ncbi:mitochondrial carrier [Aaosphaeria arxii CBS 175.79]|uniref:Mitochondrial carrier n=1 Tax=Aaosphaeria arxii CBS 175.79 TaxID=1450172 RepID=A0A6A5XH72_9PLEO|nr:mitochondrial carrier [Aaosphaeria arxii CBS 175.79]KAF2012196.1 mitochondrial carrier [Aaosphaeria arxii CBS 175.79]